MTHASIPCRLQKAQRDVTIAATNPAIPGLLLARGGACDLPIACASRALCTICLLHDRSQSMNLLQGIRELLLQGRDVLLERLDAIFEWRWVARAAGRHRLLQGRDVLLERLDAICELRLR